MELSKKLRMLREEYHLSQQEVADAIGVTRQAYGHYETGFREPSPEIYIRLADIFKLTTDYLLGRTDDPETKKAPAEAGVHGNVIRVAGRDGSYVVKQLTDEEYAAYKTMIAHLPDADDL